MSSDGRLSSAATSPICVLTHAGDFWNPSCGSRSLFEQWTFALPTSLGE